MTENLAAQSGTFELGGDLPVVRLGYGTMQLPGEGVWGPPRDHDEAVRVLRRAVEIGITFFDTADSYGPYVAEELLREALHPYADDVVIATKAGLTRQGPGGWTPLGQPAYLRQEVEMSLRRLGLERIDLFQLHRIDPAYPVADQVGELKQLQDEGKIRHIGLSEVDVEELQEAQQTAEIMPLDPMHGTVGVAPPNFEARSTLVPDMHGGNMDTPEMRAGVTCYLGVNVEGALFALGDGHDRQGEGETCGVAVEAAMDTVLIVDLIKGVPTPWPRLESDDYLMSAGSARPLEDAFRIAQHDLITWIADECGLDPLDGYQLVTQACESPIANVCDPNYTVVAKIRKSYLPTQDAYSGMHTRLREMSATYTSER